MASLALIWDLIARDGASPAFNRVAVSADRAAAATGKAETGVMSFGKKAGAALAALATIDVGVHMVSEATKFQQAMTLIQTQAGASASKVQVLSKAVLGMAGSVGTGPMKLADSLYHIVSAGQGILSTSQELNVLKVAAEGAKVGNADLTETTNALTSSVVSGIKGVQSMSGAMGALNAIVGGGDMKLSDLNEALGSGILVVAKQFGLSLRDVGAALDVFGDNNIRGAQAATSLRMAIQAFAKPIATGHAELDKLGLSTTQLAKDMSTGGLGKALTDLKAHLTAAGVTGGKVGAVLTDVFGKRAGTGIAILVDQLNRYEIKQAEIAKGATGFGLAWKATQGTASYALSSIAAEIEAAGISIGTKLLPYVTKVAQWLGTNLPRAAAMLAPIFREVGSAIGTVWKTLQPVAKIVGGALAGAFVVAAKVAQGLAAGLGAIAGFLHDNAGLVQVLVGAFIALRASELALVVVTKAVTLAQIGLDAAMDANPIGAVTAAVVSLAFAYHELGGFTGAATKIGAGWDVLSEKTGHLVGVTRGMYDVFDKTTVAGKAAADATQRQAAAAYAASHSIQYSIDAHGRLITTMVKSGSALDNTSAAMQRQTVASGLLKNALDALNGVNESVEQTQDALAISLGNLRNKSSLFKDANGDVVTSLNRASVAGATNREMLTGIIDQAKSAAQAVADHARQQGKTLPEALRIGNAALKSSEGAIRAAAAAAGLNKQQTDQLITSLGHLAKIHVNPKVNVDTSTARANIAFIREQLAELPTYKQITVSEVTRGNLASTRAQQVPGHATGGPVRDGWFTVGEQGWELARKTGNQVDIFSHSQSRAMTGLPSRLPGYAGGSITTGTVGGKKVWYYNGIGYSSEIAAQNAQTRDEQKANYTISGSHTTYSTLHAAQNAAYSAYKAELTLGVKIDSKDLGAMKKAIAGTVDQARTWFQGLRGDLSKIGALSQKTVTLVRKGWSYKFKEETLGDLLKSQDKQLNAAITARNKIADKLAALKDKMAQLASSISQSVTGAFDITSAGANPVTGAITGMGLEAQQKQALAQIREFSTDIRTLEKRHLNSAYLSQLASAGPSSLPQLRALLSLPSLSTINNTQKAIQSAGTSLGANVANTIYGKQASDLAAQEKSENRLANKIAKAMRSEVRDAVHDQLKAGIDVKDGGRTLFTIVQKAGKVEARR